MDFWINFSKYKKKLGNLMQNQIDNFWPEIVKKHFLRHIAFLNYLKWQYFCSEIQTILMQFQFFNYSNYFDTVQIQSYSKKAWFGNCKESQFCQQINVNKKWYDFCFFQDFLVIDVQFNIFVQYLIKE